MEVAAMEIRLIDTWTTGYTLTTISIIITILGAFFAFHQWRITNKISIMSL